MKYSVMFLYASQINSPLKCKMSLNNFKLIFLEFYFGDLTFEGFQTSEILIFQNFNIQNQGIQDCPPKILTKTQTGLEKSVPSAKFKEKPCSKTDNDGKKENRNAGGSQASKQGTAE